MGDAGKRAMEKGPVPDAVGGVVRQSTRLWAEGTGYDSVKLFNKVPVTVYGSLAFPPSPSG
jgi:hypothetical protein